MLLLLLFRGEGGAAVGTAMAVLFHLMRLRLLASKKKKKNQEKKKIHLGICTVSELPSGSRR
jgi:hypothetical protein